MSFWDWITGKKPAQSIESKSAAECVTHLQNTLEGIESDTMIRLDLLRDRVRGVREQVISYKLPQVARRGDR